MRSTYINNLNNTHMLTQVKILYVLVSIHDVYATLQWCMTIT